MTDQAGRADYILGADITGVRDNVAAAEAEILKSGARVEADGTSRAYRVGQVIGGGIKVVATVSTALFAVAAKGAIELQNAQAQYTAETGATADEAARAGKAINEMSGRNLQGIKEIGATLTKVRTDLRLTGPEAEAMTERFLKFAHATGQDAAGAVVAFDNVLDAWGLTASSAATIMDKLIVSHQRYGGSIDENQRALATMAPQLRALNLTIDDGIGLLNLFASSGLDAATGQRALNTAITKLPAGESLTAFLVRLSKITDDGQRAQEAMTVFGVRAGAGLANAIRPGVSSLDAFKVSTDAAAGATVKAADALDSTFSSQVQLKINAVGAAIRSIGPELTGLASGLSIAGSVVGALHLDDLARKLGPGLASGLRDVGAQAGGALSDGLTSVWEGAGGTIIGNNISNRIENVFGAGETVIGKAWRKVTYSGPARAAMTAAGAASGAIYGVAAASGEKLSGLVAGAWQAVPGSATVRGAILTAGLASGGAYGTAVSAAMKLAVLAGVAAIASEIAGPVQDIGVQLHQSIFGSGGDPLSDFGKAWQKWREEAPWPLGQKNAPDWAYLGGNVKNGLATAIVEPMRGTADIVGKAADDIAGSVAGTVAAASRAAAQAAAVATGHGIEDAVHNAQGDVARAMALMGKSLADPFIQKERLHQAGLDAMQAIADGVKDGSVAPVRAFGRLETLLKHPFDRSTYRAGLDAAGALAQGITDARQKPVDAFTTMVDMLKHSLSRPAEVARLLGELTSKELAKGLKSGDPAIRAQALYTKGLILDQLDSLKATTGPLSKDAAAAVAKGLKSKDPDIKAAALAIKNHTKEPLAGLPASAFVWGQNTADAFGQGLSSVQAIQAIQRAAKLSVSAAAKILQAGSPPGPESPLHLIDVWGARTMEAYADGLVKGGRGIGGAVKDLLAVPANAIAGASLKFAPTFGTAAAMLPAGVTAAGLSRGADVTGPVAGAVTHVNLTIHNPQPRAAEDDVGWTMRRLSALGMF